MTMRIRKAAAAALTVACFGALAAPAFAVDPAPGDTTVATSPAAPTTRAPEPVATTRAPEAPTTTRAPEPPRPTTTKPTEAPRPKATEPPTTVARPRTSVVAAIEEMVKVVKSVKLDEAVRAALLARLAEAKAAAVNGTPLDNATMQALIADVRAAVGAAKGSDAPKPKPATSVPAEGGDDAAGAEGKGTEGKGAEAEHLPGKDGVLRLLASAAAKVKASTLSPADKAALLEKIAAVQAKVESGAPLGQEELGQLVASIRAAVGAAGGHGDKHGTGSAEDAGKTPGDKALAEIDRHIAKVEASNLPDDVKAKILAALNDAKAKIAAGAATAATDGGAAARQAIEEHRKAKLDELVARLTAAADKVDAKLVELGADPANAALVAAAQAKLAKVRDVLALSATPDDLRAAWKLLREIRRSFPHPAEPAASTTVATPAPAPEPSTEPATEPTTAAP